MDEIHFVGAVELVRVSVFGGLFGEDAGDVGVSLEAVMLDQGEDAFHFALVVDVFRENVLVERIAGRAVNEEESVLPMVARPFGEELPAAFHVGPAVAGCFELLARPEDGPFGGRVEAFGVEHGSLVVIAQEDHMALHDDIDAFAGVWPVADDVAEAIDLFCLLLFDVLEDRLQGLEVAMDVADNGLHALALPEGC